MMSFDEINAWAAELGLEVEYDENTGMFRFRRIPEVLRFGEPAPEIESEWMSAFDAEELLQGMEADLNFQRE